MKGRKPTPTVLTLIRGKRPRNRAEPQPGPLPTRVPLELVSNPEAAREWRRTVVPAIRTGHITAADRTLAIGHCELFAAWRAQLAEAARHPTIVAVGPHKYPRGNPATLLAMKTLALLAKVDSELGLSPVSRSRVQVAAQLGEDPRAARFFSS